MSYILYDGGKKKLRKQTNPKTKKTLYIISHPGRGKLANHEVPVNGNKKLVRTTTTDLPIINPTAVCSVYIQQLKRRVFSRIPTLRYPRVCTPNLVVFVQLG